MSLEPNLEFLESANRKKLITVELKVELKFAMKKAILKTKKASINQSI